MAIHQDLNNTSWRFINTGFQDAYTNMAIDEVISQKSVLRDKKPVLRVYGWKPFAISLGYNQNENEIDIEKCKKDNIDIVRRPTGGRAVFHAEEVTYSFSIPRSLPIFKKDTLSIYNLISQGLVEGLKSIGIAAELESKESKNFSKSESNIPCFSSSAKYEISYKGRKLVGSAQRRFENSILQHGSILVSVEHLKLGEYIIKLNEVEYESFTRQLYKKTISISQIMTTPLNYDKIIWGIKNGFQKKFNIHFLEGQLTPHEYSEVNKLIIKYHKFRRNVK